MALYSQDKSVLVLLPPGTGSTAIESLLMQSLVSPEGDCEFIRVSHKHATYVEASAELAMLEPSATVRDVWCGTRNPFDLLRSEWFRCRTRWVRELTEGAEWLRRDPVKVEQVVRACELEFSDWVYWLLETPVGLGTTSSFLDWYPPTVVTEWLRFENLGNDVSARLVGMGCRAADLPTINASLGRDTSPYWRDYSRQARDLVTRFFQPDLKFFGYEF